MHQTKRVKTPVWFLSNSTRQDIAPYPCLYKNINKETHLTHEHSFCSRFEFIINCSDCDESNTFIHISLAGVEDVLLQFSIRGYTVYPLLMFLMERWSALEVTDYPGRAEESQQAEAAGGGHVSPHAVNQLYYQAESNCWQHVPEIENYILKC